MYVLMNRNYNDPWVEATECRSVVEYVEIVGGLGMGILLWRGQSDIAWGLDSGAVRRLNSSDSVGASLASLHQKFTDTPPHVLGEQFDAARHETIRDWLTGYEKRLIDFLHRQGHDQLATRTLNPAEAMAYLQHFGAATRFLDFTRDAATALWFAVREESALVTGADSPDGLVVGVREPRDALGNDVSPGDSLSKLIKNQTAFHPEGLFERARVQQSVLLTSPFADLAWGTLQLEHDAYSKPYVAFRIPAANKDAIRGQLKMVFNMDEESMFPDLTGYAQAHSASRPLPI
jgi:hypothetical protein